MPSIVFAVNKLDAVADAALAFAHISCALETFATAADIAVTAIVPVSALKGWNVVDAAVQPGWCGYTGPTLLALLETLPATPAESDLPLAFPVQWVEKFSSSADTSMGRRVFWGRVATGGVQPSQAVKVMPGGQTARVAQVLNHVRQPGPVLAGHGAGIVLDRQLDISRGDWIASPGSLQPTQRFNATLAWLDTEPATVGRKYWVRHGNRWVQARIASIDHRLDIHTLAPTDAHELAVNEIGEVTVEAQQPLPVEAYLDNRVGGAMIIVDPTSNRTSGALLVKAPA